MAFQQLKEKNKTNQKFRRLTAVIAPSTLPSPPLFGEENARRLWLQLAIAGNNGITIPLADEIHQHCRLTTGYQKVFDRFQTKPIYVICSLKYQSQTKHNHFSAVRQTTSTEGISDPHKNFGIEILTNAVSRILV